MPGFRSGFKESFSKPVSLENTTMADLQGQEKGRGAKSRRPPVAGVSSALRLIERERAPLCGVATIEIAFRIPPGSPTEKAPLVGAFFVGWRSVRIRSHNL